MDEVIRWNAVTESLPDEGLCVLIFVPDASATVWIGELDSGEWLWEGGFRVGEEVVAWAEMPAGVLNVERA